jgi:putative membrane protein
MKKSTLLFMAAVACVALTQACSGDHTAKGGVDSATSNTVTTDTSMDFVASAYTIKSDTVFADKAAIGGMAEVALGKMAAAKGASAAVKDFGSMMVMDHGKANAELMEITKKENITLPAGLDAEHQAKSDSLSKLSGKAFDKAYVAAMVEGHQKTLALMQSEASGGKNVALKAFAAKTAPVVQTHLTAIMKIQAGMK